ncbi:MAG: NitT/TauT family transport system substrate-binding protein [Clostridia bacterium]|nr:NitT/TauT family transport system substrate-binding protein [Clostridia bacterium]
MKKAVAIWLLLSLALLATGCRSGEGRGQNGETLKLGLIPVEDNFPFFVAAQEGLFAKAGLKVELVPFNSARDRDLALQAKNIDGEVADIVATALLRKGGTPVKIVSLTMGATPAEGRFALLARPGAAIQRPEQLKGVSVGISENTIIEYVADRLLQGAGVDPGSVEKVAVPQIPERLQLLLGGRLETALLPDPFATLAEKKGGRVILDDTKIDRNLSQVVLIFREDTLKEKATAVKKLLQVYGDAAALVSNHPDRYRELFIDKARVPAELKDTYLAPRYSPPRVPTRSEVADVQEWMVAKKLLPAAYSYGELVDTTFVPDGGEKK